MLFLLFSSGCRPLTRSSCGSSRSTWRSSSFFVSIIRLNFKNFDIKLKDQQTFNFIKLLSTLYFESFLKPNYCFLIVFHNEVFSNLFREDVLSWSGKVWHPSPAWHWPPWFPTEEYTCTTTLGNRYILFTICQMHYSIRVDKIS
jgi:hypothetical protein